MGGSRGRLIPHEQRRAAVVLIEEACVSGARLWKACEALEVSLSTFRRWQSGQLSDMRKGAAKTVTRKLSAAEIQEIIAVCCSDEYKDQNPYWIHASLLDKKKYIASVSSFYRVLREAKLIRHRRNSKPGKKHRKPPHLIAAGPNQVWTWDITWLKTDVRGVYYYAYTIIDIWDRSIVKWVIKDRENDQQAKELMEQALRDNGNPSVHIHSDDGSPMKGATLMAFLQDLGITTSFSRPRVSDDNPFIESWFKTLKYSVGYPNTFRSMKQARDWFADFVESYNRDHKHSGLHYMTPTQVRQGQYSSLAQTRNGIMEEAYQRNPHRWSGSIKKLPEIHVVCLNPTADTSLKMRQASGEIAA
jgi:putative transposase